MKLAVPRTRTVSKETRHKFSGAAVLPCILIGLGTFGAFAPYFLCAPAVAKDAGTTHGAHAGDASQTEAPPDSRPAATPVSGSTGDVSGTETPPELRPPVQPAQATAVEQPPGGTPAASDSLANKKNQAGKSAFRPSLAPTGADAESIAPGFGATPSDAGPGAASSHEQGKVENIALERPPIKALISVNDYLSPFGLESGGYEKLSLRDALITGMERNLDIAISLANSKVNKFNYYAALGKFLPSATMSFQDFFLKGALNFGPTMMRFDSPFILMSPGFRYYGYRGGKILFGALEAKHNYRAAVEGQKATLSDTLMSITHDYYNLVLNEALLQVRVQAVRISEEQLRNNSDKFKNGLATNLDVLQAKTQRSARSPEPGGSTDCPAHRLGCGFQRDEHGSGNRYHTGGLHGQKGSSPRSPTDHQRFASAGNRPSSGVETV